MYVSEIRKKADDELIDMFELENLQYVLVKK